jgi:hypothetical protein
LGQCKTFDFVNSEDGKKHLVYKCSEQLAQASIDSNYRLSISVGCGQNVDFFEKITINRKVLITIESLEEKHYKEYRKIMSNIRNFLTLGITQPVYPLMMNGLYQKMIKQQLFGY